MEWELKIFTTQGPIFLILEYGYVNSGLFTLIAHASNLSFSIKIGHSQIPIPILQGAISVAVEIILIGSRRKEIDNTY